MLSYSRSHLADHVLLRTLAAVVTQDLVITAEMLALVAEVDRRGLFRGEGYSSMYRYCVQKLRMSEDVACKRILAARAARRFPAVIPAIAEGRLSVSTVALLSPCLKTAHDEDLLTAAFGKTRAQVEVLIAERFPKPDVPTTLVPLASPALHAPALLDQNDMLVPPPAPTQVVANTEALSAPGRINSVESVSVSVHTEPPISQRRVAPLSPGRFELRLTISQELHDKLKRAQELLGHSNPTGDLPQLLERAIDELIAKQEKLKFAATDRPRSARHASRNPRYIPAKVKREVRERDAGRCTFESDNGHRCEARTRLEYDHALPVARGGLATADNIRLDPLSRVPRKAHNQLEAERVYGSGFMRAKRGETPTTPATSPATRGLRDTRTASSAP